MGWLQGAMIDGGKISPNDLNIIRTADTPEQAVEIIVEASEVRNGAGDSGGDRRPAARS